MSAEPNAEPPTTSPDPALPPTTLSNTSAQSSDSKPVEPAMAGANSSSGSSPKKSLSLRSVPTDISSLLSTTDSTLTRLNALLKTPGGLASLLSTFNYSLYILAHLHLTAPSRAQIIASLSRLIGRTPTTTATPKFNAQAAAAAAAGSPILNTALMVADLRTTLRLTGLIPLYALLKSLIQTRNQSQDTILHTIKITQALGYTTFQLLENISHLTNKGIIPATWTNAKFNRLGGQANLVTWSCRGWLVGISCEFLRLLREAQLQREKEAKGYSSEKGSGTVEEQRAANEKWWSEFMVACSWYPMAWHYSVPGGVGLNLGMVGLCGFGANLGNFLRLWLATQA